MKFNMNLFNILIFQLIHQSIFLYLRNPLLKMGVLLLKTNYMDVFTIKLLISNRESFELDINLKMITSSFSKTYLKANFADHLGRLNKRQFFSWLCLTPTFHTLLMLSKLQICTLLECKHLLWWSFYQWIYPMSSLHQSSCSPSKLFQLLVIFLNHFG